MKILVLDNYDSFTYNLVHIIKKLGFGEGLEVIRNDKVELESVGKFDKILLSPGPGVPEQAGVMKELIKTFAPNKSILGVCLGHQGIAEVFGAELYNMKTVQHGLKGRLQVGQDDYLFQDIPSQFSIAHYHSWTVDETSINGALEVIAHDEEGKVMAIRHKEYDVRGLQFHPESIITENGIQIIENWIKHKA